MKEKMKAMVSKIGYYVKLGLIMNVHSNGFGATVGVYDLQCVGLVASAVNPRICRAEVYGACVCTACSSK